MAKKKNFKMGKSNAKYDNSTRRGTAKDDFDRSEYSRSRTGRNDVNWYVPDPNIKELIGRLAYNIRLGSNTSVRLGTNTTYNFNPSGILRVDFTPVYGAETESMSTLQRSAYEVETYIRSQIKMSNNYDASAIMSYLILCDSAYTHILNAVRALAACNMRSVYNAYEPQGLVEALGFDYDDMIANWREYLTKLNFLILDMRGIFCPNIFNFISRHMFMCGNIFKDEKELENAQLYVMNPVAYWTYEYQEQTTFFPEGFMLKLRTWLFDYQKQFEGLKLNSKVTFGFYLDTIREDIINVLLTNAAFKNIGGDLLQAYGYSSQLSLPTLDTNITVEPVYSAEFMLQIHNSMAAGYPVTDRAVDFTTTSVDFTPCSIYQRVSEDATGVSSHLVPSYAFYKYNTITGDGAEQNWFGVNSDLLLDVTEEWSGDPDTVIEATRLTYVTNSITNRNTTASFNATRVAGRSISSCGSEIVNGYCMFTVKPNSDETQSGNYTNIIPFDNFMFPINSTTVETLGILQTFKVTPIVYSIQSGSFVTLCSDMRRWGVVTAEDRKQLHEMSILGLFKFGTTFAKKG